MTIQEAAAKWMHSNGLGELHQATLKAKQTVPDVSIQAQNGLFRVVRVEYTKRSSKVTPLSEWITVDRAVAFLESLCAS